MYAGGGLLLPYWQSLGFFPHENDHLLMLQEEMLQRFSQNHLFDDSYDCQSQLPIISSTSSNLVQTSTISEYDLGGEGELFKAPEPIIEEQVLTLDPVTTVISMMSAGEDMIAAEAMKVADNESIETQQLLSEIFCECKKDLFLLENSTMEEPPSDLSDIKIQPLTAVEEEFIQNEDMANDGFMQKSVSSTTCLGVTDRNVDVVPTRPNFLGFQEMNFEAAFGMRRAYSEGNIKILGDNNPNVVATNVSIPAPQLDQLMNMDNHKNEERQEKLSRYRKKKSKRNFGRKIKYACRKALADCQPRIRGRFAKSEECELLRSTI